VTGLRDTRCRDVVRNYSSLAQAIDSNRIIKNIFMTNEEDKESVSLKGGRLSRLKYPKLKITCHHFLLIITFMTNWQASQLICETRT